MLAVTGITRVVVPVARRDPRARRVRARFVLQPATASSADTYVSLTDTIKRRLEASPSAAECKRSRIPLALRSPVPIKRELQQRRTGSLERALGAAATPASDSDQSSTPATPDTPRKDSSTFNLLKDSDLFTQISENKISPSAILPPPAAPPASEPCHVVSVTSHEIVKSSVSAESTEGEPAEAVMEFVPSAAETVRVIDDTELDSSSASSVASSDTTEGTYDTNSEDSRPIDLGSEPQTFVVEVRTLEQRMKPTRGVVTRRGGARIAPDLIPAGERTRPDSERPERTAERTSVRGDEHNEYLILDEVPREQPALPEPSLTDRADRPAIPEDERDVTSQGGGAQEEVIYSEVEDTPQVNTRVTIVNTPLVNIIIVADAWYLVRLDVN